MEYTNVLQSLRDFVDDFHTHLEDESLLGVEPWSSLLETIHGIQDLLNDPVISAPIDNYKIDTIHPIDKLGLGDKVLRLSETCSPKEVTAVLTNSGVSISVAEVKTWLVEYENKPILTRAEIEFGNVFDTKNQLQELFIDIKAQLEEIKAKQDNAYKRTSKDEVIIAGREQVRQLLKDAAGLISTMGAMEKVDMFKRIVFEEINKASPELASTIMRRLKEQKSLYQTLDV